MSDFKPIESQEDFEKAISQRLEEERAAVRKEFKGYLSPDDVSEKYKDFLSPEQVAEKYKNYLTPEQAAEKDLMIKKYEKNSKKVKIAMDEGIPYELAGRISGETEEDMKKDARTLAGFLKKTNTYPGYEPEPYGKPKAQEAAIKKMLNDLKGE